MRPKTLTALRLGHTSDISRGSLTVSIGVDGAGGVGVGVGVVDGGGVGGHGGHGHLGGAGGHDDVADGAEGLEGADVLQERSTRGQTGSVAKDKSADSPRRRATFSEPTSVCGVWPLLQGARPVLRRAATQIAPLGRAWRTASLKLRRAVCATARRKSRVRPAALHPAPLARLWRRGAGRHMCGTVAPGTLCSCE